MSEKLQHNAERTREQMSHRYGDVYYHKHDKRHHSYRLHCRSHLSHPVEEKSNSVQVNCATGHVRKLKLQKLRKRLAKNIFH